MGGEIITTTDAHGMKTTTRVIEDMFGPTKMEPQRWRPAVFVKENHHRLRREHHRNQGFVLTMYKIGLTLTVMDAGGMKSTMNAIMHINGQIKIMSRLKKLVAIALIAFLRNCLQ